LTTAERLRSAWLPQGGTMIGRITVAASGCLALFFAGCDSREPYPDSGSLPIVQVDVTNENLHDVDIYAVENGTRLRVARLWGGESGTIDIGPPLVEKGEFILEAYAIGMDATYRTTPITIMGQVHIQLRVGSELGASTFSVNYGSEPDSISSNPTS
jgi:hypothetical protein